MKPEVPADRSADASAPMPADEPVAPKPASLPQVFGAVIWSFFGIRRGSAMQRDAISVKPIQVILVGVLLAAGLVVGLLLLVRVIMSQT